MKSRNDPMDLAGRLQAAIPKADPATAALLTEAAGFLQGQFDALNDHDALVTELCDKLAVDATAKDLPDLALDLKAALDVAVPVKADALR
jgi:hypothetical protein